MGRHVAPELDCPTEVMVAAAPAPEPDDGAIDLGALVRNVDRKTLLGAVLGVAAIVAGVCVGGLVENSGGSHSSSSTTSTTSPAESAREQGVSYGEELRDQGYNSMSISVNCEAGQGGYSGDHYQDFIGGCTSVSMEVLQHDG